MKKSVKTIAGGTIPLRKPTLRAFQKQLQEEAVEAQGAPLSVAQKSFINGKARESFYGQSQSVASPTQSSLEVPEVKKKKHASIAFIKDDSDELMKMKLEHQQSLSVMENRMNDLRNEMQMMKNKQKSKRQKDRSEVDNKIKTI